MQARDFSVTDIRFDPAIASFRGNVRMHLTGGRVPLLVSFVARADRPEDCPRSLVIFDLLKDALRQARDLPPLRKSVRGIEADFDNIHVEAA